MSSSILRKAVVEQAPLLIDNTYAVPYADESSSLPSDLVEELQLENPDAAPDEIEDALKEVMDQLREQAPEDDLEAEAFASFEEETATAAGADDPWALTAETTEFERSEASLADSEPILLSPDINGGSEALEDARREAQEILAQADERAAEIERAAYDKGFSEGVAAGRASGEEQSAEMVKQAVAIVDSATEVHDMMLREAESEMVALCLEVARKIIQSELRTNPEVVNNVLAAAVKKINGSPRVTIKVNPSQVEAVRSHWDAAFGPAYREKEWIVEGDPNVSVGGCALDTKYGAIDARIGTQFGEIQKTFALLLGTGE